MDIQYLDITLQLYLKINIKYYDIISTKIPVSNIEQYKSKR